MIIVDAKLSETTALTSGQNAAKNQVTKGNLSYKPKDSKGLDINFQELPTKINQGDAIPISGFYKLYGDGNQNFEGVIKL
ncbi:peptidase [Tamlana carrageenivorans]|uniref:Peptidase n=2 Tax=Pseudotamlana carrageenivorans TaxID=2069432 RepID=A0A2I7SNC0_9FLAO|nr:peptidase [Tamlana carrageenivorans]